MTLDDWIQNKGKPTLSKGQVKRLAKQVADNITELGYSNVIIPLPSDYRAVRHLLNGCWCDLVVKIRVGNMQVYLPVFAEGAAIGHKPNNCFLAKQIVSQICHYDANFRAAKNLSDASFRIRRYLRRNRSDIILKSLEYKTTSGWKAIRELTATFDVLDNLLRPASQIFLEHVSGQVSSELREFVKVQKGRRALINGMPGAGKMLEIDSLAEYAITAAGRSVIEVAREMCARNTQDHLHNPVTILDGHLKNDYVVIYLIDACLSLKIYIKGFLFLQNEEIIVSAVFPELVKTALAGEELIRVVDHPMIKPDARIAQCKNYDEKRILLLIEHESRLIPLQKLVRNIG
jgi:hypothetical protein